MKSVVFYVVWPILSLLSLAGPQYSVVMLLVAIGVSLGICVKTGSTVNAFRCLRSVIWVMLWPVLANSFCLSMPWIVRTHVEQVSRPLTKLGAKVHSVHGMKFWSISCDDASVDDAKFAEWIPVLTHLNLDVIELSLDGSCVTDRSVSALTGLSGLSSLSLRGTYITDRSLQILSQMKKLRSLFLSNTCITDQGMKYIAEMEGLSELDLQGTAVSDDGLALLMEVPRLERIDVRNTRITADGAAGFEERHHPKHGRGWVRVSDDGKEE
jgi:Leucine Rich repeat